MKENVVLLNAYGRRDATLARASVPSWNTPSPIVALNADRPISDLQIADAILSKDPSRIRLAIHALNDRMQRFGDIITGHNTVHLSTPANFPTTQTQGIATAVQFGDMDRQRVDTRWTNLFTVQDRRAQNNPYFKVVDLYHAVQVDEYLMGERIQLRHVEGSEAIFEARIYAAGLQWLRLWSEWQDQWSVADGLAAMQNRYAAKMAALAIQALTASGLSTTAYDTTGADTLQKDVNTINQAILDIVSGIYQATSGSGIVAEELVGDDTPFYLLYNNLTAGYDGRVTRALAANFTAINSAMSAVEVRRPVVPFGSPLVPTGNWYIVLPGRKNVAAIFRDLRFYPMEDVQVAGIADAQIGQGAFRMVRGDARQVRKLALS